MAAEVPTVAERVVGRMAREGDPIARGLGETVARVARVADEYVGHRTREATVTLGGWGVGGVAGGAIGGIIGGGLGWTLAAAGGTAITIFGAPVVAVAGAAVAGAGGAFYIGEKTVEWARHFLAGGH